MVISINGKLLQVVKNKNPNANFIQFRTHLLKCGHGKECEEIAWASTQKSNIKYELVTEEE